MIIKILLIILGIPILILPLTTKIIENKKLSKSGMIFLVLIISFAFFQFLNEKNNLKNIHQLSINNNKLKNKIDSLTKILLSIDSQFSNTRKELNSLGQINDSLGNKLFESGRPILNIVSTKIIQNKKLKNNYEINIIFNNNGKRPATNIFGKMYSIHGDTVTAKGTVSLSRSDIYSKNQGFTIHEPMKINPDSTSLKMPIYYYINLKYSDLISKSLYNYEIAMKLKPFKKGNFLNELVFCREWETSNLKERIHN